MDESHPEGAQAARVEDTAAHLTAAIQRGDLLLACDIARRADDEGLRSPTIAYGHVLALARMGETERALAAFDTYGLERVPGVDPASLRARLLKDQAFAGSERLEGGLERAAAAYRQVYDRYQAPFPGINAASLSLLCGRTADARTLAEAILRHPDVKAPASYFDAATKAEALVLIGRLEEAHGALVLAHRLPGAGLGAASTTRRQIRRVAVHVGLEPRTIDELLAPLAPPCVATFCGHRFDASTLAEHELVERLNAALADLDVGIGFGALASGADILVAERLLARGGELNVVLPFRVEDFVRVSVGEGGWADRFHACLGRAYSVTYATETSFVGDPLQFRFGGELSMGLARMRARLLDAPVVQLAVWDGAAARGEAGTAVDVATWRSSGGRTVVVPPPQARRPAIAPEPADAPARTIKSIIFADFVGFSKIPEHVLPAFWDVVMKRSAEVLDGHAPAIAFQNAWGDALYAVVESVDEAAVIALELQDAMGAIDFLALGIDPSAGMRIGAHVGPVYRGRDHITARENFYGSEVSRAARIEPITPPGAVYVTEQFAAALALAHSDAFACEYVGRLDLPKRFGEQRMYRLTWGADRAEAGSRT